ncbi:ethanolamine utilization protein EutH [Nostocoides australiense]|nr:ethanolamine utilization protein EutH [Actinomycetota bacterium]MCB1299832.1 ethanolamine utilization protein EutH [Tetrasphaera sp.]HPF79956.1 ethanolamine utilization protein EutH [Tetrasphaera australiensis]HRW02274.1 ethanolamine utilization protein EutH [Tetrasphaera sp.]
MSINEVILWILMICMALGAIDRAIGNRFGLGEKFEDGFNAMGPLALSMVGVYALSPILAKILRPVIGPVYNALGADPAMFAGTLLANDMGGWPLAQAMTDDPQIQKLSGLVLGAMMGATIVFTIPVALGITQKEDRQFLSRGVLAGIVTIPLGVITSGLIAGIGLGTVLRNTVPILIVAVAIALGLYFKPEAMTRGFELFGKGLVFMISIGLGLGVFETMTGHQILTGEWALLPVAEGFATVALIAMALAGAFPAVHLIVKFGSKPLSAAGRLLGVNDTAAGGFIATLANNIAMFEIMKKMDARGKILNCAFAVSAAFALGDHLGFTAGVMPDMIAAVIVGKLVAGITAVVVAYLLFARAFPAYLAGDEGQLATVGAGPDMTGNPSPAGARADDVISPHGPAVETPDPGKPEA